GMRGGIEVEETAARDYPEELPVGYYVGNFLAILDFVDSHYDDVLTVDEKTFSRTFRSLSLDARRLYVRLMSRKGPLFRSDTLVYNEIDDIEGAAEELVQKGFLEVNGPWELEHELVLLRKPEVLKLISCCAQSSHPVPSTTALEALRRDQLVELAMAIPNQHEVRDYLRGLFHLYRPLKEREILIYRLLFFGNLYQDLTEFVVTDLGHVRYESYKIRKKDRLFRSREVLEHTFRLIELNDAFYQTVEGRSVNEIDANALLSLIEYLPEQGAVEEDPGLRRMRDNLINGVARHLERIGNHGQALHLYRLAALPPSRERQVRILERQGTAEEALELCRKIMSDPWEAAELEFAERYIRKLSRKLGLPVVKVESVEMPTENLELVHDPLVSIEEAVLRYFQEQGFSGYHAENVLWVGLFGLAFWDIVFLSLPGTFFNRYQRGPRDLFRPEFRRRRAKLIEERLNHIESSQSWLNEILDLYDRKRGIANDLVHWKFLSRELLEQSVNLVPRRHLVAIFDKLSQNPGANKSGFPDLILFPAPRRQTATRYELIEVKGPGDQLQINQKRWLKYFAKNGIPYRIIRVQWRE
ncbi:MAG: VRR-NUC domain-containing protein, partial [Spirochaetales bacterium]|nr:VRR-NUC domain-containing protein [Spirochaetales bacterium]